MPSAIDDRDLESMIDGYQTTALLCATVRLRLADLLAEQPATAQDLARVLDTDRPRLLRLLKALIALGICTEEASGKFGLTTRGHRLTAESGSGLRERVLLAVEQFADPWFSLDIGTACATTAFEQVHRCSPWEYRKRNPATGELFDRWLTYETRSHAQHLAPDLPLEGDEHVVDVGGGSGALLAALRTAAPALRATLFEQPHVIQALGEGYCQGDSLTPFDCMAGDFFTAIPVRADVYILKSILHDWDDAHVRKILEACRNAMPAEARLLLIERMLPDSPQEDPAVHLLDMHMMIVTGGEERSLSAYTELLRSSGFQVTATQRTATPFTLFEARPR